MTKFEEQIWAGVFAAEYVRFRAVAENLHEQDPKKYLKPDEAQLEYSASLVAMGAIKKIRALKKSEDAPYLFLEKET